MLFYHASPLDVLSGTFLLIYLLLISSIVETWVSMRIRTLIIASYLFTVHHGVLNPVKLLSFDKYYIYEVFKISRKVINDEGKT